MGESLVRVGDSRERGRGRVSVSGLRLVLRMCFFWGGTFKKHSLELTTTILC